MNKPSMGVRGIRSEVLGVLKSIHRIDFWLS